jgi:hypothetical protein
MAYIGKEPIVGNFQKCDAITVVNGQAAYTLQVSSTNVTPESSQHCLVSLNGILQAPVTSFSVSGSTLTFASNLVTNDVIDFVMLLGNVLDLGVPSDNTVTTAKIADDAVTYAKASGFGKVLQVLTFTVATQETTTSDSFTATALLKAITPSASSSKILILASGVIGTTNADTNTLVTLYKDSTNLGHSTKGMASQYGTGGGGSCNFGINYLDSPSTTSETTYRIYFAAAASGGHTQKIFQDGATGSITLMEIGA